jgi:tetratricopeptide (TPR) repeat protein
MNVNMKKLIYSLFFGVALLTGSCSDFTDVQPKGKNLLSTTDQLEMLLNNEFYMRVNDMRHISGDIIYAFENVPTLISRPNKTLSAILITWDVANQDKMAELTSSDNDYAGWYGVIGKIANPILSLVDKAEGEESVKNQLKAEALVLRAYFHYLLVNKFAKAYNPASAETDPGIPYMKEDWDISIPSEKRTVKEVYENIIADLDAAIELNALPIHAVNRMRMNKPSAYAAKALALMSMQRFDEAAQAAQQALAINNTVNNYNEMLTTTTGYILGGSYPTVLRTPLKCEEDYFFTYYLEFFDAITTEAWNAFEPGHASRDKIATDRMMYDYLMGMGLSYIGIDYTFTYDLNSGWNQLGMKTTQMYLIIAETEIRKGDYNAAMDALDAIRVNRIDPSVYAPLKGVVNTKADAIFRLKQTSHGENIYTIYNFINRKRWNQLDDYKQKLVKTMAGKVYELEPDSPLWIFPFPLNAVNNNPNLLPQNYKQ